MKANLTWVGILLDRSGSMENIGKDVIGGFNTLIKEQKQEEGELTVTAASFSDPGDYTVLYDAIPLNKVSDLTPDKYRTSGSTALNDSFARLINEVGAKLAAMSEDERPSKVLMISFTDGEENASNEYSTQRLRELIKHQEEVYGWQFLYMGANQDSFHEGVQMRGYTQSMNFMATEVGTQTAYALMSRSLKSVRKTGKLDTDDTVNNAVQKPKISPKKKTK